MTKPSPFKAAAAAAAARQANSAQAPSTPHPDAERDAKIAAFVGGATPSVPDTDPVMPGSMQRETYFVLETTPLEMALPRGIKRVAMGGKVNVADKPKSLHLYVPAPTAKLLAEHVQGVTSAAIVGLVEFALQELQRQNLTLAINNA